MDGMTDIMVDLETTGTAVDTSAIIQIAAVKFNYETEEIGGIFNRCLAIAPNRFWDESTRTWWMGQKRSVFDGIIARMEDPATVLHSFRDFVFESAPLRFWSKPTHFDFPLLSSYFRQFGMEMPFHYRFARDLNTFLAAMNGGVEHVGMPHIEMVGDAHNALADCVHQLKMLFAARDGDWAPVIEEAEFTEVVAGA